MTMEVHCQPVIQDLIRPLDFIDIDDHKILKVIRNLNSNKAHGCDDISIRMLKICDDSIFLPLRHFLPNA